ncbi:MAG: hypothetical protein V3S06_00420, partial [candidate division Zixibacteria bacterium]
CNEIFIVLFLHAPSLFWLCLPIIKMYIVCGNLRGSKLVLEFDGNVGNSKINGSFWIKPYSARGSDGVPAGMPDGRVLLPAGGNRGGFFRKTVLLRVQYF